MVFTKRLAVLAPTLLVGACAVFTPLPEPSALEQRLAAIPTDDAPVRGPISIHWNQHQVPFVEAEHDLDGAFGLGLVHAHLRLGQMEIMRRVAQGRLAEMGGPLAVDVDHGIRVLGFDRAVPETLAAMTAESREWIEAYVAGINHYQRNAQALPHEYRVLGLDVEPWQAADILTIGRLAGSDVNWFVWFNILKLRKRDDWPRIWARLVEHGADSVPSFDAAGLGDDLGSLLYGLSRSGSNSLAVAPSRTETGAAIMANDPHLGILLPNVWLLAGLKTPSYHVVGMMAPGLPIFAIGRNPDIAWGGTNMRAASSELFELPNSAAEQVRERRETVAVRWWPDQEIVVRESPLGPVLSDAPQLAEIVGADIALRWTGHRVSDEIGAMLGVSRATTFDEFRGALRDFAVPGQNLLYADTNGNIAQVMAAQLPPWRDETPPDLILSAESRTEAWQALVGIGELPYSLNPKAGFLASANNRPSGRTPKVGFFFSPDDRVRRMKAMLGADGPVSLDDVKALQQDVYQESAVVLRDLLIARADELNVGDGLSPDAAQALATVRAWDGRYDPDSAGAVAFEGLRAHVIRALYEGIYGDQDWAAFAAVGRIKTILLEDLARTDGTKLAPVLAGGLAASAEALDQNPTWGDMHRLGLEHPLSFLPLVGDRYRFGDYPVGGSSDTLMKTAHEATTERHDSSYGSNARHISDMSDLDANYFVLLGGQDGWLNSSTFSDQVALWRAGDYIRMPLRLETVDREFPYKTRVTP